ncbi:hypothetical protein J580_0026 [Acinetobacter sp. 1542444]|nr:hypothetical protein ABD1_05530 [Acinetobacter baumannii D1279779]EXE62905.1 hypothetical protein J580_0026 [Acinetobacter sp. 1542444]EXI39947.1 hypothetical protein J647_1226 [Acinetobacter baumannii 846928]
MIDTLNIAHYPLPAGHIASMVLTDHRVRPHQIIPSEE